MIRQASEDMTHIRRERRVLLFYIVLDAVCALRYALWFIYLSVLQHIDTTADLWLFYLFIWAQIGLTTGADVLYVLLAKFLHHKGLLTCEAHRVAS